MFRAPGGKSEDWMVWVEQWPKQKRKRLLVARAGTECWPERLLFPLWSLVVSNAFEQRRGGLNETVLEGATWGQCELFKEGDVISTSLEEQGTGVSPHRFSLRLFC